MDTVNTSIKKGSTILTLNIVELFNKLRQKLNSDLANIVHSDNNPKFASGYDSIIQSDLIPNKLPELSENLDIPSVNSVITLSEVHYIFMKLFTLLLSIRRVISNDYLSYNQSSVTYNTFSLEEQKDNFAFLVDSVPNRFVQNPNNMVSWFDTFVNNNSNKKPSNFKFTPPTQEGDDIVADGDSDINNNYKTINIINYLNTMYSAWKNAIIDNTVTYNLYRCHSVCYSNCYHRSRR